MRIVHAVIIAFGISSVIVVAQSATVQNTLGFFPSGTITPGDCVKVGATANSLVDNGPCPAAPTPLAIGQTVIGASSGACLTVDANGKLAQASCLTAQ
jgi:hypothetical protein